MTRWLAILLCSIALCCSGAMAFAQGLGSAPQLAALVAPDEGQLPADAEPAQPDMSCDFPELFDNPLGALPSHPGSAAPPRHATAALSAPFIEGPQRPPRGFGLA